MIFFAAGLLVVAVILGDYYLYPVMVHPSAENFNQNKNGLWLGSKWYMGKVSDADFETIANLIKKEHIHYAFFHCKDINKLGKLRIPSEAGAKRLVSKLHELCPGVKIMVWMGALGTGFGGEVDETKEDVRKNMAASACNLVSVGGFDGFQWDLEPVGDNNSNFLELLDLTRNSLPKDKILSVCAPGFGLNWSPSYIEEVSKRCDLIALMAYDTGMWLPRLYVSKMESLIALYANAIALSKSNCRLLVGVPAYEDVTLGHHAHAENIELALVGVKNAMQNKAIKAEVIEGVAPYAEYTTDASEWQKYEKYWLHTDPLPSVGAGEQSRSSEPSS